MMALYLLVGELRRRRRRRARWTEWKPEEIDGPPRLLRAPCTASSSSSGELVAVRGARRVRTSPRSSPRMGRDRRHRRPLPGVQGVGRRLPDLRRRLGGSGARDRREALGRSRAGWLAGPATDPGAAGDGGRAHRTPPRWTTTSDGGRRARTSRPQSRTCCASRRRRSSARSRAHGRLRRRRGRRAGGADRGGGALAERRHPGEPARVAARRPPSGGWSTRGAASGPRRHARSRPRGRRRPRRQRGRHAGPCSSCAATRR